MSDSFYSALSEMSGGGGGDSESVLVDEDVRGGEVLAEWRNGDNRWGVQTMAEAREFVDHNDEPHDAVFEFRNTTTRARRKQLSTKMHDTYPNKVGVIIGVARRSRGGGGLKLKQTKFLCGRDLCVGQFAWEVRKTTTLRPDEALFLFTEQNTLPATAATMGQLCAKHANEDGFLYLIADKESVFG